MIVINGKFLSQHLTGVQRYALEMTKNLLLIRNDIVIVAPAKKHLIQSPDNLPVTFIGNRSGIVWEQFELTRWLKRHGSPLLLNFCNSAPLNYKNTIVTIHDLSTILHPEWFSWFFAYGYRWMLPELARKSRKVLTVSETVKSEMMLYFKLPSEKIEVVSNGLPESFKKNLVSGGFQKKKQILAVGSFDPRKNLPIIINAFSRISEAYQYKLIIAGRHSDIFLFKRINLPEIIKSKIEIRTDLSDQELIQLYRESEIYVNVSSYEGFGIPVVEALSMNCKIILSDIPVFHELFESYAHFSSRDAEDLKITFEKVISEAPTTTAGQNTAVNFSYEKSATRLNNILLKLS